MNLIVQTLSTTHKCAILPRRVVQTVEVLVNEKKGIPTWLKVGCGCGCVTIIGVLIFLASAGALAYKAASDTFMLDPVRIQQLAERTSAGSKPPSEFTAKMGMDFAKVRLCVFQDSSERGLMLLGIEVDDEKQLTKRSVTQHIDQNRVDANKQNMKIHVGDSQSSSPSPDEKETKKTISQDEITVECHGKEFPAIKRLVEENGSKSWEYLVMGKSPKNPKLGIGLLGTAPESNTNDSFWREYAKTVELNPLGD